MQKRRSGRGESPLESEEQQPRRIYSCASWRFGAGARPTQGGYERDPPPAPCGTSGCGEPL